MIPEMYGAMDMANEMSRLRDENCNLLIQLSDTMNREKSLRDQCIDYEIELSVARVRIKHLEAENDALIKAVAELDKTIADLERRLSKVEGFLVI